LIWFPAATVGGISGGAKSVRPSFPVRKVALAYPGPCKQIGTSANWYSFLRALFGYDGLVMRYVGFHTAPLT